MRQVFFGPKTITAYFPTATAIYPGDEVRIAGVKVGTIDRIEPEGTQAKMTLEVDRDVPDSGRRQGGDRRAEPGRRPVRPAHALLSGGRAGRPWRDGGVIPADRTAVPVEWDEVKTQLTRLATDLGPQTGVSGTSISRFVDSAANALGGNGEKLRETLTQLSGVARIFAEGSGNIVDIIKNLQIFVTALRDSKEQIVLFQNRLASFSSVLDDSRSDLDAALSDLSVAMGEVQRFVAGSRDQTAEQIQRLGNLTQVLVDNRLALENVLHITPNAIANFENIYYPNGGSVTGAFSVSNFSNPVWFVCGLIGGVANTTAPETAKLCAQLPRSGTAAAQRRQHPVPDQRLPEARGQPGSAHLHRSRSSHRAAPGPVTRRRHHRRCRPTPARATSRRPPAGTRRPARRESTRPTATHPRYRRPRCSPVRRFRGRPTSCRTFRRGSQTVDGLLLPPTPAPPAPATGGAERASASCRRDAAIMIRGVKRLTIVGCSVALSLSGCAFQGVNSLPLPGAVGRGPDAVTYHVQIAECCDAGVEFAGHDQRRRRGQRRQDDGPGLACRR